jgi:exopolyphosphatase/guanosine-5'-triphosphate,3'-diphosphate pyrophosphatase
MRIAAIDLGSNSIHLVIVEVGRSGGFKVIDREKEMVRLGSGTLSRGRLSADAMKRGLEALREYRRLADTHGVEKIIAVATSAIREAANGEDFLERIGHETNIWPKAISGDEEARLIYLAALHSIHLEGKRALVLDIGGGSVEVALGAGSNVEWSLSEKLGVLRMSEEYVRSDPMSPKDEAHLVERVETILKPHVHYILERGFDCAVGTSGTILALGRMAHEMETGSPAETLHHLTVQAETLHALRKQLVASDLKERLKMSGMDEERVDIIAAGSVIADTLLSSLKVKEITLCDWALREGILLNYIHGHPRSLARAEAYPDVRRRSVLDLAERCLYDEPHATHVTSLSLSLFDATKHRHGLSDADRSILEYASLLHDIGHHISYPGHHKHSYYLVKNGDLRGFSPLEIEVLANVARYHRRGLPRKKHAAFAGLHRESRRTVRVLAGLLRVADALDRSHRQVVRSVAVSERSGAFKIRLEVDGDCELELWGARRRAGLLEGVLGLSLRFEAPPEEERLRMRSGSR